MQGLVIWASTNCRSTLALYREIKRQLGAPVKIAFYIYKEDGMRATTGFRSDEFSDIEFIVIGEDYKKGLALLDSTKGYSHLFTIFQRAPNYKRLIIEAGRRGMHVALAAESPCNMSSGLRWVLKELYDRFYLPIDAKDVVRICDFFVNYSGSSSAASQQIGWDNRKFVPFGYFPPPLDNSNCVMRNGNKPFIILSTGVLSKYRGADILVDALAILKERNIDFTATITQDGELLPMLKAKAQKKRLPIAFPGFVPMRELVCLYENCSVYVGTGRSEPWGMRLNDALNCGAPLVVSRGMGGVQLVDEYGCGLSFETGNAVSLADALQTLAENEKLYAECARHAALASRLILPAKKASELIEKISKFGDAWGRDHE